LQKRLISAELQHIRKISTNHCNSTFRNIDSFIQYYITFENIGSLN